MIEQGKVVKVEKDYAYVSVDKKDECSKCGMCLFPKNASKIEIRAKNDVDAKLNDLVTVEKVSNSLFSAILVFAVPILLIALSAVITYLFIKQEMYMVVMALGSIAVWYSVLAIIDKKLGKLKKFTAKILKINSHEGEN